MADQEEGKEEVNIQSPSKEELELQTQKIAEAEEKARKADEARIRAEAERDTVKNFVESSKAGQTPQITDAQWEQIAERTGQSKEAILANASVAQQIAQGVAKELEAKAKAAEEKAARAEERLARLEAGLGKESVKKSFFESRPALVAYKADVEEFLSDYPDSIKNDPKQLEKILQKAEVYVKGKVGEKMRTQNTSPRFGKGGSETEQSDTQEIDVTDLSPREAELIRNLAKSRDEEEKLKEHASMTKHGVVVRGDREWMDARTEVSKQFGKF